MPETADAAARRRTAKFKRELDAVAQHRRYISANGLDKPTSDDLADLLTDIPGDERRVVRTAVAIAADQRHTPSEQQDALMRAAAHVSGFLKEPPRDHGEDTDDPVALAARVAQRRGY